MRGLYIMVLLVLVLPTAQPGPSSPSLDREIELGIESIPVDRGGLLITEICPGRPVEYVVLTNQGDETSLEGMTIDDGEGNITILANITVGRGDSLAVVADGEVFSDLHPRQKYVEKGSASMRWSGKFVLADGGDEVFLRSPDRSNADTVIYGSSLFGGEGWTGPAVGGVYKGHAMVRCGTDTNSSIDWKVEPPGRSDHQPPTFDAVVEPFSAPETATGRLAREISMASRTVNCSVYEISDAFIVDQLARCASRGVEVNILVEGQPVGGLSQGSKDAAATLVAAGADVRELRSVDSYKRYDYLHSKYMVVDNRRVTVMSENWGSGLYANRGWGVTMDGPALGAFYDGVFDGDFNGLLDIVKPRSQGSIITPPADQGGPDETVRYRCQVTPIISPEGSAATLGDIMDRAMDTILVEQLSVQPEWLDGPSLLNSLVEAAERGVRVRMLLDSAWDREDNQAVADRLNALALAKGLDLEAKIISPYHGLSVMHNKGLVVDDLAVISSINWGDSALYQNREVGVAVSSQAVSGYFSSLFWEDWALDPEPPVPCLPWTWTEVMEGQPVLLDATNSSDNARLMEAEWDIGGDGTVDSNSTSWAVKLPPGNHTIVLTLRDRGNNTASATCWVSVVRSESPSLSPETAALLASPLIVVAVVIVRKRINHGKNL